MDRPRALDPLETLYARRESLTNGDYHGAGWGAHAAILDRLAANQRVAQSLGWIACAIERPNRSGRFEAWGVPPHDNRRHPIPDWSSETT